MTVNLPIVITLARVALAPVVGWLALSPDWSWRAVGFCLFVVAAVSDYIDGSLARARNEITDTGKLLDPLADKLLLGCTMAAMYVLQAPAGERAAHAFIATAEVARFPFEFGLGATPVLVPLPGILVLIVLGREVIMTVFRQIAARRGVMISAIGPAKWKTGFQSVWAGAAFAWFPTLTLARLHGWEGDAAWRYWASFNALVGAVCMVSSVVLTVWSLWLYARTFGRAVFAPARATARP